ncbi:hypothetical protein HDU85_005899 [Gaertneriomyces sp. JEL0708]|nr:hypothetical protein HDU85_005899 [Gaertneriomyces sp. JEL0708]
MPVYIALVGDCDDYSVPAAYLFDVVSEYYNIVDNHRYCQLIDVSDIEVRGGERYEKAFVFPFISDRCETFWAHVENDECDGLRFVRLPPMTGYPPLESFDGFVSKDADSLRDCLLGHNDEEIREMMGDLMETFILNIANPKIDDYVDSAYDQVDDDYAMLETESFVVGVIKAIHTGNLNDSICGMLLSYMESTDCDLSCLGHVDKAKRDMVLKASYVHCNPLELGCAIDAVLLKQAPTNMSPDLYVDVTKVTMLKDYLVSHVDIKEKQLCFMFYVLNMSKIVYSENEKSWYKFDKKKHGWEVLNENSFLKYLNFNFLNTISRIKKHVDSALKAKLNDIAHNTSTDRKRSALCKSLCSYMDCKDFDQLLDSKSMIRFEDGVFVPDVAHPKGGTFREGRPDDYALKKCHFKYRYNIYNDEDRATIEAKSVNINSVIKKLLPNKNTRKYFMKYLATCFLPGNREKIFVVLLGSGNNGKSLMCKIMSYILGDYYVRAPTSQLMGRSASAGSASEDIVDNNRARVITYMEPDKKDHPNIGFLKDLTGGDGSYKGRRLFQHNRKLHIDPNVIINVNHTFNLGVIDKATEKRMVVVPFISEFVETRDLERISRRKRGHVYEVDKSLMDRCNEFSTVLTRLILNTYLPMYFKEGLAMSEEMQHETEQFKFKGDPCARFLKEEVDYVDDADSGVHVDELFSRYQTWYTDNNYSKRSDSKPDFISILEMKDIVLNHKKQAVGLTLKKKSVTVATKPSYAPGTFYDPPAYIDEAIETF